MRETLNVLTRKSCGVAAAPEAGCARLLGQHLQHGQQVDGLRVEDPFRAASA